MSSGAYFHAIQAAPDPAACTRLFLEAIAPYGMTAFACGEVDLAHKERTVMFALSWPDSWRSFYIESGFVDRDPIVSALPRYREPFSWSDLRRDRLMPQAGSEALALVAEHGWTEGLVVPIVRGGDRFGLISLVGAGPPLSSQQKGELGLLSLCLHARARTLAAVHGFPAPPAGLSKREIDCLTAIASGLSDAGIAARLGIARTTAHEYCENARRKLKAGTRAEAVAIAVSLGIFAT